MSPARHTDTSEFGLESLSVEHDKALARVRFRAGGTAYRPAPAEALSA